MGREPGWRGWQTQGEERTSRRAWPAAYSPRKSLKTLESGDRGQISESQMGREEVQWDGVWEYKVGEELALPEWVRREAEGGAPQSQHAKTLPCTH